MGLFSLFRILLVKGARPPALGCAVNTPSLPTYAEENLRHRIGQGAYTVNFADSLAGQSLTALLNVVVLSQTTRQK